MKPFVWKEGMADEETKNGAYWERNMLALFYAVQMNKMQTAYLSVQGIPDEDITNKHGWYQHQGEGFEGWSRVVSLHEGHITFHVPDDFNLGDLPEIEQNWDGHTTEQKWTRIMNQCGIASIPIGVR